MTSDLLCVQDFFVLPEPTSVTQAAKATALDNVAHSTAPPYGATCMDFHKVKAHPHFKQALLAPLFV